MQKINMKIEVVNILSEISGIADFSTDYPEEMTNFPYVVYRTVATPYEVDAYRNEIQTQWQILIEIYGEKSVSSIATSLYNGMRSLGCQVTQRDSNVAGIKRIVLDCKVIVDNNMKITYL